MSGVHDDCIGEPSSSGGRDVALVVAVVMHRWADVEAFPAMVGP